MADSGTSDPPQCPGCGYNLTGLPKQGTCPECGGPYDTDVWAKFVTRPPFGYGLLAMPPIVFLATGILGPILLGNGGEFLGWAALCLGLAAAGPMSNRLATWRYSTLVATDPSVPTLKDPEKYIRSVRRAFILLEIMALLLGTWPGFILCFGIGK